MATDNSHPNDALFNISPDVLKLGEATESYLEQLDATLSSWRVFIRASVLMASEFSAFRSPQG